MVESASSALDSGCGSLVDWVIGSREDSRTKESVYSRKSNNLSMARMVAYLLCAIFEILLRVVFQNWFVIGQQGNNILGEINLIQSIRNQLAEDPNTIPPSK